MADLGGMAKNAMGSDKGEKATDAGLDKAGDAANKATGGKHSEQIEKGEHAADGKIGQ